MQKCVVWFSLLEFGEITGLNTGPLPTESFEPDQYKAFWEELKVPLGMGPKLDELKAALEVCPLWSFGKRKWLGLLLLQTMGLYCLHHSSRIPFESAIRVFDDEAMRLYPWGRTAYEVLVDSIKILAPDGGSYTISGMKDALLIWAYESVACFGEVHVRRIVLKDSIEEMFPQWPDEPDEPQLASLITDIHLKKVKTQKEVNTSEVEAAATGKGSSVEEDRKDLEGNVTMFTLLSAMENMSRKFDHIDSRFNAYELDRNRPLVDQKTFDDMVKASVEERLKVLGVRPLVLAKTPELGKTPELAKTPGLVFAPKRNLAKELDKDTGVKRSLAEEFGSGAATPAKAPEIDFLYVSPAKATKATKATKDDKDAKGEAYGRGMRGRRIVKDEHAADKKKAEQADAALKKKEKADARKKQADIKKQHTKAKKKKRLSKGIPGKNVQLSPQGFALTAVPSTPVFPYIGDNGTTCMRKNFEPSSAMYDPLAPVDPVLLDKLMQHISRIPPKPPAPANKKVRRSADHEGDFYSILIHERSWLDPEYGWVFDNVHARSTPLWSKRIAFLDPFFLNVWVHDYKQFKIKPNMMKFKGNGYESLMNGEIPVELPTNLKWYEDVDHLYGCLQTGGNHWVAFHVDLKDEKIDCYDPIFGEIIPESEQKMVEYFKPLTLMLPVMLREVIPPNLRTTSKEKFAFRRRSKRYTPQNTQVGDCGVYSLKFVECLELGVSFYGINDKNIQGLRMKMAAEILDEGGYTAINDMLAMVRFSLFRRLT
ncbi:hypothetical protein Bca4012_084155 [Brassica carinata]